MKPSNNPIIFLSKYLWRFSEKNRKNVVLYVAMSVIANSIWFLPPLVVAKILNIVQEQGINQGNIWHLIGIASLFIAINLGHWIFHGPSRVIERKNAFIVRANYKKYLLDGTMNLPPEWHVDHHSGDTIDKIEKGTDSLYRFSSTTFEIIESLIKLVSSYLALVYFNIHSSYIVMFIVIMTIAIILHCDKKLSRHYKELNRAENRISQKIFDTISNITTVIILRIEKLVSGSIMKNILSPFNLFRKNVKLNEIKWWIVSMMSSVMIFTVIGTYFYSNLVSGKVILVGTLYALYGYVERINGVFFRFASKYGTIVEQKAAVENAEEISVYFKEKDIIENVRFLRRWKEIRIENLKFSYHGENGGDLHLNDISFRIKKGEKIALVGESGSGKTTFLKMIRGLYEPQRVNIYLDDRRLKNLGSINENITLIPQEPEIFATTIKENITMGVDYSMDFIKEHTDLTEFTKVIKSLPKGIESSIFEKGVNLSGGEKQRLALARGLIACEDKAIVLLDEPTSSVDSANELKIYQSIFRRYKDKSIISSIHRLHLLHMFDRIYVFNKGKIVVSGTLDELLKKSKRFKVLWKKYHKAKDIKSYQR